MSIYQPGLHNIPDRANEKNSLQLRKLANTTDGPVLAFLNSPTNIPRLFAVRIANLLSASITWPENILCLMPSASSVHSLKNELSHLIADDAAKFNIYTVHSFCEKVMESYVLQVDRKHPTLNSTLETVQLLKELIAAFPTNHPLKRHRADVYCEINNLKKLFAFIKQKDYTTEKIYQQIDAFQNQLTTGEPQADFKSLPIEDASELIEKLRAGISEFNNWQKLLQKNNRYDADDLVAITTNVLEENEKLRSFYQQQFKFIQAEEQALTGKAAKKLLSLLIGENKHPNILLTTYQDDLSNKPAAGIHLTDIENDLTFNWIKIQPEPERNHSPVAPPLHLPTITSYQSIETTLSGVANKVSALLQENVSPTRIAIASPGNEYDKKLKRVLANKNIPFYSRQTIDILQEPFIKKLIQILRYLSTEIEIPFSGDDLLFEILHFDFFKVPPIEIARLSVEVNSKKYGSNPTSIRQLLQERAHAPAKDLFDTGMDKHLKKVSAIVEKLIQDADSIGLKQLLGNIQQDPLVQAYVNNSYERIWLMQILNAWTGFIEKEIVQNPGLQLNQLVASLDTMQVECFPVSITCTLGAENGVQLVQLEEGWAEELDYLFIIEANDSIPGRNNWVDCIELFTDQATLPYHDLDDDSRYEMLSHLLNTVPNVSVSFSKYNSKREEWTPTGIIAKIISDYSLSADEAPEMHLETIATQPEIASLEKSFIAPIVKKFVMNVSALNSYINCPLGFYYKNILRIPNGKSDALEFGSAIHYALEQLFKKMAAGYDSAPSNTRRKEEFPSATEMIADFKLYMHRQRANFTREAFERRMVYGEEVLKNYYAQYINSWNKVVSVERNIRGVTVNGVPLKGKLDKLEFDGKDATIVDYKSGDIEKALKKINPPNESDPNGGDYWRQAVFYKILVDNYNSKAWRVTGTEFDFIEPDKNNQYRKVTIQINAPDIQTVTQQLTASWQKIQSHDFYTGCGKPHCHWCNFVVDNHLAVAMHTVYKD